MSPTPAQIISFNLPFRQDPVTASAWGIFSLSALCQPLFLAFFWLRLPPQIPLFFSRPWGEAQLAPAYFLLLLPSLTLLVGGANLAASRVAHDLIIVRMLAWAATIFSLLSTVALVNIIRLAT